MARLTTVPTFQTHIKPIVPVAIDDIPDPEHTDQTISEVELAVPNGFTHSWLEKRHRVNMEAVLSAVLGRDVRVRLVLVKRT